MAQRLQIAPLVATAARQRADVVDIRRPASAVSTSRMMLEKLISN
jgi:hypothetical protein